MKTLLIAIALTGLTVTPAFAQSKAKPRPAKAVKAKGSKAKRCADRDDPRCARQVDFTKGDKVEGDRPTGDGDALTSLLNGRFGPLIRLRTDFNDMIFKSAESL